MLCNVLLTFAELLITVCSFVKVHNTLAFALTPTISAHFHCICVTFPLLVSMYTADLGSLSYPVTDVKFRQQLKNQTGHPLAGVVLQR